MTNPALMIRITKPYLAAVEDHLETPEQPPALMLFLYGQIRVFVLCVEPERMESAIWREEDRRWRLQGHQGAGVPVWIRVHLCRIFLEGERVAAVRGPKIKGSDYQMRRGRHYESMFVYAICTDMSFHGPLFYLSLCVQKRVMKNIIYVFHC